MKFDLDAVFVEHGCAGSALATRILRSLPRHVRVTHVADAREVSRPASGERDPFGAGKRRMVIARRKTPFLNPVPCRFLQVRLLRIPRAHARIELPDGLLVLLSAGISG